MNNKIRIAIATEDNVVGGHFGHCPEFTLVDIEDKKVVKKEVIPNPGHQPGFLPIFLSEKGINVIIAGGMGVHAQELFLIRKIIPVIGVTGNIDTVINSYIEEKLEIGESQCSHGQINQHHCKGG